MVFDYPAATIVAIHDGDTITVQIDYGFSLKQTHILRLYGINAPELATQAGKDALAFLLTLIKVDDVVDLRTQKDHREKFGRVLATIFAGDVNGVSVNQRMVDSGHAVPFMV